MAKHKELLMYGNWSGPGWSNGHNFGGRVLSTNELRRKGIDAYDNYVAKSHDLNEIFAAHQLRESLAEHSQPHKDLLKKNSKGHYIKPLTFAPALKITDTPRFAALHPYLTSAKPEDVRSVAEDFYVYFEHLKRSNLQFAIDYVWNEVSLTNLKSFAIFAQLFGASHFFLEEAKWLEDQQTRLRENTLVSDSFANSVATKVAQDFVSPGHTNAASKFILPIKKKFIRKVPVSALLATDRESLKNRAAAIRDEKNS